jgi:hypothetical protein
MSSWDYAFEKAQQLSERCDAKGANGQARQA